MKTLLFVGHPGHELLAYKFMTLYKPDVVFLTDGSGSNSESRIHRSIDLVECLGLKTYSPFTPFTDRQIYNLIKSNNIADFLNLKSTLKSFIIKHNYQIIVGDALEGFNPSHDLCRYLINSIVMDLSNSIKNYEFYQDDITKNNPTTKASGDLLIKLNENEFQEKSNVSKKYLEVRLEVDKFENQYDKELFTQEYFREVKNPETIVSWETKEPSYEKFGRKRVEEGIYNSLITFENHMKVLAEALYK